MDISSDSYDQVNIFKSLLYRVIYIFFTMFSVIMLFKIDIISF